MSWVFSITFALLAIAGLLVVIRLLRGRTTLDRIVSVDVLVTLIVAGSCAGMGFAQDGANIALLAAFALLAFIGSISAAKLIEKKEPYR